MLFVTNRKVKREQNGNAEFTEFSNPKGDSELRLVLADQPNGALRLRLLPDRPGKELDALLAAFGMTPFPGRARYTSEAVAFAYLQKARQEKKNVVFFVHGFNTKIEHMVATIHELEARYNVLAVGFSWPSRGRVRDYLSDKGRARESSRALERAIERMAMYVVDFNESGMQQLQQEVETRYPDDVIAQHELFRRKLPSVCPVHVTLMCHSMGNYVYKWALKSTETQANPLIFSNILLVAADVNNEGHADWVDKLHVREDIYIVINQNDYALKASRIKPGKQQKARLGHYLKRLDSTIATYVDVTPVAGDAHGYFMDDTSAPGSNAHQFFQATLNGADGLPACHHVHGSLYRIQ